MTDVFVRIKTEYDNGGVSKALGGLSTLKSSINLTSKEIEKLESTFQSKMGGSFIQTLGRGQQSTQQLGMEFLETARSAGIGGRQIEAMASSTGLYSSGQLKAASVSANLTLETDRLVNQLKRGEITAQEAGKQFGELAKGATAGGISLRQLAIAVGVVTTALVAMKKGFDFAQEGAMLSRLEDSGDSLAASYGANMDEMLAAMKRTSMGTVAETDLILAANRAMMLGVTTDAEQMANLLEVAALRGRAMGLSTSQAFNDIVTGIGRMSPLILDNLGIVLDLDKRTREWAKANGVAADSVDAATKRQILLNGVLEEGNRQLEEQGGLVYDTAAAYEKFGAQGTDAWNRVKMAFGEFIAPAISGMADAMESSNEFNDIAEELGATFNYSATAAGQFREKMYDLNGVTMTAAEVQGRYNQDVLKWLHYADLAKGAGQLMAEGIEDVGDAATTTAEAMGRLDSVNRSLNSGITSMIESLKLEALGISALTGYAEELVAQYYDQSLSLEGVEANLLAVQRAAILADSAAGAIGGEETIASLEALGLSLLEIQRLMALIDGTHNVTYVLDLISRGFGGEGIESILSAPAEPGNQTGGKKRSAAGSEVYAGRPYMVGELGAEPFFPAQNGRILSRNDAMQALSEGEGRGSRGNLTIYGGVTIQLEQGMDPREVIEALA